MPFIGKSPQVGAFQLIDSITTSATDTYALTVTGSAYVPESARNLIVSLNGVTQAPESAYTVSGSNIVFASALTASDVIDYILVIGDAVDIGTPSDGTVGNAQLKASLDLSGKTLTFDNDQISGDYVHGGTISNFASTGIDDNATSTAITIDASENVGIGTASPNGKLDITGSGNTDIYLNTGNNSGDNNRLFFGDTADIDVGYLSYDHGTNTMSFGVNAAERMRIDSSGNVGIGTTSPLNQLVISEGTGQHGIEFAPGTTSYIQAYDRAISDYGDLKIDAQIIQFGTDNGTERMRINASGNVGIGTSSPSYKLMTVAPAGTQSIFLAGQSGLTNGFTINSDGSQLTYSFLTGNVGIGTTSPTHDLTVGSTSASDYVIALRGGVGGFFGWDDSANTTIVQAPNTRSLSFQVNSDTFSAGTEAMRIDSSGNVGIGTSSPDALLNLEALSNPVLRLGSSDGTVQVGDTYGTIEFYSNDTNSPGAPAKIQAVQELSVSGAIGALTFTTGSTASNAERMRIDSSGNVGIGVSSISPVISSSKTLQLSSSGNTTLSVRAVESVNDRSAILELLSSGNGLSKSIILYGDTDTTPSTASPLVIQKYHSGVRTEVGRFNTSGHLVLGDSTTAYYRLKSGATGTDGGIQWMFNTDATVFGSLTLPYDTRATTGLHLYSGYPITYTVPGNKAHQFVTGGGEAARIDADGIKFNGDTAATNALDDYEEGNWTPTIVGNSGASGQTYSVQTGLYVKIGNTVNFTFDVGLTNQGTLSGTYVVLGGLPFSGAGSNVGGGIFISYMVGVSSSVNKPVGAYMNSSLMYLMESGAEGDYWQVNEGKIGNSTRFIGWGQIMI